MKLQKFSRNNYMFVYSMIGSQPNSLMQVAFSFTSFSQPKMSMCVPDCYFFLSIFLLLFKVLCMRHTKMTSAVMTLTSAYSQHWEGSLSEARHRSHALFPPPQPAPTKKDTESSGNGLKERRCCLLCGSQLHTFSRQELWEVFSSFRKHETRLDYWLRINYRYFQHFIVINALCCCKMPISERGLT